MKLPYGGQRKFHLYYWDAYEGKRMDSRWYLVAGYFAKVRRGTNHTLVPIEWYHCREVFQGESRGLKWMLFCHKQNRGLNIVKFIHCIERKLNVRPFTQFGPTQSDKVLWIKLSPWWMKYSMRRSFFTALLRAAQNFNPKKRNYEKTLWTNRYFRQTKYATRRFLRGYTKYTGHITGWNNQFYWGNIFMNCKPKPPTPMEVRRLLVKS
jgi:hypothetical protein